MNKRTKAISILLALMMALSLFGGLTVFAEGEETPAADVPVIATLNEDAAAETTAPTPESTAEPSEKPTSEVTPEPDDPFITNYEVSDFIGNWYNHGDTATIRVTFMDEWASKNNAAITARVSDSVFSAAPQTAVANGDGTFTVTFTNVLYKGGSKNFSFELLYDQPRKIKILEQPLAQCDDTFFEKEPEPTPAPTKEPDLPKIMVKDFSFGGNSVEAGKEFVLDLTLFTTSGNTNLQDVMVGLNFPADSKNVSLASGSMNTYVGTMGPNATRHITYKMITDATMEPGAVAITVQLTSKDGEGSSYPISIPVTQVERFEITNMEVQETMMMGEEGVVSVTFVNKGKSPINNLSAEVQGENLANPGQSQFLGNIAPGSENSVDFSLMASAEGVLNGKVLLSYEDAKGEVQTLEKEFSCNVEAMPMYDPDMDSPEMGMETGMEGEIQKAGMPWWGWTLVAVGIAAVIAVVVVIVLKKKKAKAQAQLEEDDEDF